MTSNAVRHPDTWNFYREEARNIMEEPDLCHLGNYRIPVPDKSGNFIYANEVTELWRLFILAWYRPALNSPSVYGRIQYIVQNF